MGSSPCGRKEPDRTEQLAVNIQVLRMIISRSVHIAASSTVLFFFMAEEHSLVPMC